VLRDGTRFANEATWWKFFDWAEEHHDALCVEWDYYNNNSRGRQAPVKTAAKATATILPYTTSDNNNNNNNNSSRTISTLPPASILDVCTG